MINVALFGESHTNALDESLIKETEQLAEALIAHNCGVLINAHSGYPFWIAKHMKRGGGVTILFSPARNKTEHDEYFKYSQDHITLTVYSGIGISGNNVMITSSADIALFGPPSIHAEAEVEHALANIPVIGFLHDHPTYRDLLKIYARENTPYKIHPNQRILTISNPYELVTQLYHLHQKIN